jgi:hypothetical protein
MASEFEKHIAMQPNEAEESTASKMYSQAKDQISEATQGARETVGGNPGTFSAIALLIGVVGFALGWAYGQSSARPPRYWH